MRQLYYIGLDIHKKMIAYCIKELDGRLVEQGKIDAANRKSVGECRKYREIQGHGKYRDTILINCKIRCPSISIVKCPAISNNTSDPFPIIFLSEVAAHKVIY